MSTHDDEAEATRLARLEKAKAEWLAGEPLSEKLPIRFPSGSALQTLEFFCSGCDAELEPSHLRGKASRPRPDVAAFEAWGFCADCRMLTRFSFRVRGGQGLQIEWRHAEHGWVKSEAKITSNPLIRGFRRLRKMVGLQKTLTAHLPDALMDAQADFKLSNPDAASFVHDVLTSNWVEAINAELAERGMRGLRPTVGSSNTIIMSDKINKHIVRLRRGALPEWPESEHILKPLKCGELGPFSYEIFPRPTFEYIPQEKIDALKEVLANEELELTNAAPGAIGWVKGRLMVLDPTAVTPFPPFTLGQSEP